MKLDVRPASVARAAPGAGDHRIPEPDTPPVDFDARAMPILAAHWFGIAPAAECRAA